MTSKDLAILIVPMLLSLIVSLAYGKRMLGKEMEFPKAFAKAVGMHGRIIVLGGIGWTLYASGLRQKIIGVAYYGIAFLVIGIIDYVVINRMSVGN